MRRLVYWLLTCALFAVCPGMAVCLPPAGAPAVQTRFALQASLAHDRDTGLLWQRCLVGARWVNGRCMGNPFLMTHDEASRHAAKQGQGWRLPTVDELAGLLEARCHQPAIDSEIFPDVRPLADGHAKHWTSSPVKEIPSMFYNIDFMDGATDANTPGIAWAVRLVRR